MERAGEGLRERKKRLTRQRISDTATALFLERGFDRVTVAEVAAACDVSEKTVFNYFPTKESLLLDREDEWTAAVLTALGTGPPVEAMVAAIVEQLDLMSADNGPDVTAVRGVGDLIRSTPSLRAANEDMTRRIVAAAAELLAGRVGVSPDDPEPQIAADALIGLWRVQFRSLSRYADGSLPPAEVRDKVVDDVRRAARLIDTGLWSFGVAITDAEQAPLAVREGRRHVIDTVARKVQSK